MEDLRFEVRGRPTPFSGGENEGAWKEALADAVPEPGGAARPTGLRVHFTVAPRRQTADLDNLVEPVLSVLVNRRGWFAGSRTAIDWFIATKRVGEPTGAVIELGKEGPPPTAFEEAIWSFVYSGPLPRSASDPVLSDWIQTVRNAPITKPEELAVELGFHDSRINLGDIATGSLKATIDGLWPAIGGSAKSPADHRIARLAVRRTTEGARSGVDVAIGAG